MDPRLLAEHRALHECADLLLRHLRDIESYLLRHDSHVVWHSEWAHRGRWLHSHLASAVSLSGQNRYPAALTVLRTALEHHLVDRLIYLGTAIVEEWKRGDREAVEFQAELERLRLSEQSTIRSWAPKGASGRTYRVVRESPHVRGTDDVSLSWYHLFGGDYNPTTPRAGQLPRVRRNFVGLDLMKAAAERASKFWDNYYRLPRVLENLAESKLIDGHERLQIELHYSFLSGFVHATGHAYNSLVIQWNAPPEPPRYDHYASELVLLYVIRLATEDLRHLALAYERPPSVSISGWSTVERQLRQADELTSHFWFLGRSGPHDYDRVVSVDDEMFEGMRDGESITSRPRIDYRSLTAEQIRYDPDPLQRLIRMHTDHSELTTGTRYRSPFPREDARLR